MPQFDALMRVVHVETWSVEAKDAAEAREKISKFTDDVIDDDSGGEVVDWEVISVSPSPQEIEQ